MKTDDLIQKLSHDLKPVKPMTSPLRFSIFSFCVGFVFIALGFLFMPARSDLREQIFNPVFLIGSGLSFLLAASALFLSAYLSRPGQKRNAQAFAYSTAVILFFVLIYDGFRIAQLAQSQIHLGLDLSGFDCFFKVMGFTIISGAALFVTLRKGAAEYPKLSGIAVAAAAAGLGNVAITFFCGSDNGMHLLVWHFALPMLAGICCGALVGRYFLRW